VTCKLTRNGFLAASAEGSANSFESKYRWRWVAPHEVPNGLSLSALRCKPTKAKVAKFQLEQRETSGQYGKPESYWQAFDDAIAAGTAKPVTIEFRSGKTGPGWEIDLSTYRIPNEDTPSQANTILKMAQKRAFIAAVLFATGASEYFTQDLDDMSYEVTGGELPQVKFMQIGEDDHGENTEQVEQPAQVSTATAPSTTAPSKTASTASKKTTPVSVSPQESDPFSEDTDPDQTAFWQFVKEIKFDHKKALEIAKPAIEGKTPWASVRSQLADLHNA
jgi:hypothetical protein